MKNGLNSKANSLKLTTLGFTLIELLAVILILGIIALIAVPTVNDVLNEAKMGAFKTTAMNLASKAEETCQLDDIKGKEPTYLYTIVEGKLDKPLEIKGDMPDHGYILVNNSCETAFSFYDSKNVVSKNFDETKAIVNNKESAPAYGLNWISDTDDTYVRTLDASDITLDVEPQKGTEKVSNPFDTLDIYKDILPYTDEFGNKFMLIPKFYISKSKETEGDKVIWNYAVSKQKKDDTYYLPSNFVDEGVDNNQHIELPYVLVGKYEAGSNGASGDEEILVSKSGLMPRVNMNINTARTLATRYNDIEGVNGYQQYDIHVHDLITMLFAIEFGTMNSQSVMRGYVDNAYDVGAIATGGSDGVVSSSGSLATTNAAFNYRGIENLWGNVWSFIEGVNIDQISGTKDSIYTATNARHYSSNSITEYYTKLTEYTKLNSEGYVKESGFDSQMPFVNLPTKVGGSSSKGTGDYFYQNLDSHIKITLGGGNWALGANAGMSIFNLNWYSSAAYSYVGSRILKTPLQG